MRDIDVQPQEHLMGEGEHSRRAHVIRLRLGDSSEVLRELEDASVGAVITDPPYG